MRNITKILGTGLVCLVAAQGFAKGVLPMEDANEGFVMTLNANVATAYIDRGYTWNDGFVFQPSIEFLRGLGDIGDLEENSLGFNAWGNMNLSRYDRFYKSGEFSEIDLSAFWTFKVEGLDAIVQYTQQLFPLLSNGRSLGPVIHEFMLGLSKTFDNDITVGGEFYYDYSTDARGVYVPLYVQYTLEMDRFSLTPRAHIGFITKQISAGGHSGLNDYELRLTGKYALNDATALFARIGYVGSLDTDVLPRVKDMPFEKGGLDTKLYGLVGVSYDW